jgi:RhtB (resistance to homoserine/threonine) family protein
VPHLLSFLVIAVVVVVTPGVDTALVTKNALLHGRRAAIMTALGVNAGIAVWTTASALGLGALLHRSEALFTAVKLAGAAYLVGLGVQALWHSWRRGQPVAPAGPVSRRSPFAQGILSNLLNPKIAVFFTSFLPQFVSPDGPVLGQLLLLGAVFNLIGVLWLCGCAVFVSRVGDELRRPRVRSAFERVTGCVLIAFGVRLATERR